MIRFRVIAGLIFLGLASAAPLAAQSQITPRPTIAPQIDQKAVLFLELANQALVSAKTVRGKVQTTRVAKGKQVLKPVAIDIWAAKPGSLRINEGASLTAKTDSLPAADLSELSGVKKGSNGTTVVNGEALEAMMAAVRAKAKRVRIHTPAHSMEYASSSDTATALPQVYFRTDVIETGLQSFFGIQSRDVGIWTSERLKDLLLRSLKYVGPEQWNGKSYDVVEWIYENAYLLPEDTVVYRTRLFIGNDHIVHRSVTYSSTGLVTDREFDFTLNAPVAEKDFALPRQGMTVLPARKTGDTSFVGQNLEQAMPSLEGATLLDQGAFNLKKVLAGKKGALLWNWASGCPTSTAEFPIAERWFREYGPRGLAAVALDYYGLIDEQKAREMRRYNSATVPIALGATAWTDVLTKSGNSVLLVDGNGQILYHGPFDTKAIEPVLQKLVQ